jgi:hypothetical protein
VDTTTPTRWSSVSSYDTHTQENNAGETAGRSFSPNTRVQAAIGPRTFTGRVLEAGYDGEPVVYIEDTAGHERVVRVRRETHDVRPTEEGSK